MSDRVVSAWTQLYAAFVLYLIPTLAVATVVVLSAADPEDVDIVLGMAAQGVGSLVAIGATWLAVRHFGARLGIRWRGRHGAGFHVVGAYALFLMLWFPFSFLLYPWLLELLGTEMQAQEHLVYFADPEPGTLVIMIAVICVIGPIYEEILFRAFAQTGLQRVLGRWVGWIVASALFGLLHGVDIALPLALMGAFFGYLRDRDDGLFAPMLAHMLHNSVTVAMVVSFPDLLQEAFDR